MSIIRAFPAPFSSEANNYSLYGFLFGTIFPLLGATISVSTQYERVSLQNYWFAIKEEPLLWIIALAPIILALFARIAGVRQDEVKLVVTDLQDSIIRLNETMVSRDLAEAANQAKSTFLATMSHELRTPLNAIIGYTEMLEEELVVGVIRPSSIEDIVRIRKSGKHLLGLIKAILDLSKVEAGEEEVCIEPITTQEIMDALEIAASPLCIQANNRLEIKFNGQPQYAKENIVVLADRQKLCQILLNLVSNANKFTNEGAITVSVLPKIKSQQVLFSVSDTGIGIPVDQIDNLFQPFVQLDNAYNRKYEGTGLGLAISSKYCHLMGGEISAHNQETGGAEFQVTLPASFKSADD